jgi:hypothetical protein
MLPAMLTVFFAAHTVHVTAIAAVLLVLRDP